MALIMTNKKQAKQQTLARRIMSHVINIFVPRDHNSYHPHLISRYSLAIIALMGAGGILFSASVEKSSVLGSEPTISAVDLLEGVNAERTKKGEDALTIDHKLADAALAKGKDMFKEQYWAHNSPRGTTPWKWIQDQGYNYLYAGENLAKNYPNAKSTVAAWMASPTHRDNMLRDYYTEAGFAIVDGVLDGQQTTIVVALFATPASMGALVAGTMNGGEVGSELGVLPRIGVSLQSMDPATLGAVSLSALAIVIAVVTFMSTHLRQYVLARKQPSISTPHGAWHRHHTVSKTIGLSTFVLLSLALFGGGQL